MRHAMSALVKKSKSPQIVAKAYASAAMRSYLRAALRECNVADVDGHHEHIQDRTPIGAACIRATLARQTHAVCLGIFEHELRGGKAAGDVDAVVVAAEFEFFIKKLKARW